jgi:hypothetical protein
MAAMNPKIASVLENFPFLSYGQMLDQYYLGIIQNSDNQLLSMYVLDLIPDDAQRVAFLRAGDAWWWNSNRQIPIHIFLKERMRAFRPYLRHFSRKDFNLISGPCVSLQDTISRRVRRRQVTLVKRPD